MSTLKSGYIQGSLGALHTTAWLPEGTCCGAILLVQGLFEEANKLRHACAQLAKDLAARGWYVLCVDPYGTGDSAGEFAEADWSAWCEDLRMQYALTAAHCNQSPIVWGVRAGALLARDALADVTDADRWLWWAPVGNGDVYLNQFLRLEVAGQRVTGGSNEAGAGVTLKELRAQLEAGQLVEVAGYAISPALAKGLAAATLSEPPAAARLVTWLEVGSAESLSPAAQRNVANWQTKLPDLKLTIEQVPDAAGWAAVELETMSALRERSLRVFDVWQSDTRLPSQQGGAA